MHVFYRKKLFGKLNLTKGMMVTVLIAILAYAAVSAGVTSLQLGRGAGA